MRNRLFWLPLAMLAPLISHGQPNYSNLAYQFESFVGLPPGSADAAGSAARFDYPVGVATDSSGNIYVADSLNGTVRVINPATGATTTLAGQAGSIGNVDGPGAAARFGLPSRLAVDVNGYVFVGDQNNGNIRKIAPDGTVATFASGLTNPGGIAVDSFDNVYVINNGGSAVTKFTAGGAPVTFATLPVTGIDLTIDPAGNLYVAEQHAVREITASGVSSVLAGSETAAAVLDGTGTAARFGELSAIGYDATQHRLLVVDGQSIRQISASSVVSAFAGVNNGLSVDRDGTGPSAQFSGPQGLAVSAAGAIYVADSQACTIRAITPSAVVTTLAGLASDGNLDGVGSAARFFEIQGMTADPSGNIYVADTFNGRICKISPNGSVATVAPYGGWSSPLGLASDKQGNIYVAEAYDVREITTGGAVLSIAGTGVAGDQDGNAATAQFGSLRSIAVDANGNIFVGDETSQTLRKITPAGVVSTVPGVTGAIQALAFNSAGVLYAADTTAVHQLNLDGSYTLLAGSTIQGSSDGKGAQASFTIPQGIAVDANGNILVVDSLNETLRLITPDGYVTTVAGANQVSGYQDGSGANARFHWPTEIAVTSSGAVYVADSFNHCVRMAPLVPPAIVSGPASQTVDSGQNVTFSVTANASAPTVSYQWTFNGQSIAGATNATYTLSGAVATNSGAYAVAITGLGGTVISQPATLTVIAQPPVILYQPVSITAGLGQSATFTVGISGSSSVTYQWAHGGVAIPGATGATLTISNVVAADVGLYSVLITGSGGSVLSNSATLNAIGGAGAPVVSVQPTSATISTGGAAVLTFSAQIGGSGATGVTYQWWLNGAPIAGATSSQLLLTSVTAASAGTYLAYASYAGTTIASPPATLTVANTADVGRLINCSVLNPAGTPGEVLTLGITTQGASGNQPLLIRGIGPALSEFGVPNPLPNPTLTVFSGSTALSQNSGWASPASNATAVTNADTALFAFPLSNPASLDAALVVSVATNASYTVQIASATRLAGAVLGEIYDATLGTGFSAATPHLTNLSCLSPLLAQGSLTTGFTVGGSTACTVLIRASGPALSAFNISSDLPDPQLQLHTTVAGQDTILQTNAAWGGTAALLGAETITGAFAIADSASKDAAILITLNPGTYTAQVTSPSGSSGNVLIELYAVP